MSIPGTYTSMTSSVSNIEFIGSGGRQTDSSTITMVAHPSTQTGDLVIIVAHVDNAYSISTPAGWTSLGTASGDIKLLSWYRTYNGSMPTISLTSGSDHIIAESYTFRNVNGTPIDVAAVSSNPLTAVDYVTINGTNYLRSALAPVTTVTNNALVLLVVGHEVSTTLPVFAPDGTSMSTSLTNVTKLSDISTTIGFNGGFGLWSGLKESAGSIGTTYVHIKYNINTWGFAVALRPQ